MSGPATGSFVRYELLERIGAGGMAEVIRARAHREDGSVEEVVVKKILPGHAGDETFRKMFMDEVRIVSRLSHPNLVGVLDAGRFDEELFLALEYVEGCDVQRLARHLEEQGDRLSLGTSILIVTDVLDGLHHAHTRCDPSGRPLGIVHRDVSPQNVLVSIAGEVKLTDFGIAVAEERESRTQAGFVKGHVLYIAPEQMSGAGVDCRTDVYAAGMLLHRLLAGRHPFQDEPLAAIYRRSLSGDVPGASSVNPSVPTNLDRLVARATKLLPAERFASAADFRAALLEFAEGKGLSLDRRPLGEQVRKVRRRGPSPALEPFGVAEASGGVLRSLSVPLARLRLPSSNPAAAPRDVEDAAANLPTRETALPSDRTRAAAKILAVPESDAAPTVSVAISLPRAPAPSIAPAAAPTAPSSAGPPPGPSTAKPTRLTAGPPAPPATRAEPDPIPTVTSPGRTFSEPAPIPTVTTPVVPPSGVTSIGITAHSPRTSERDPGCARMEGHAGPVHAIAAVRAGRFVVSGGEDQTLRVWDLTRRETIGILRGHAGPVTAVSLAREGWRVLSGGADRTLRLWDPERETCVGTFQGHHDRITGVAVDAAGQIAVSACRDGSLRVWDIASCDPLGELAGHAAPVAGIAFLGESTLLSSLSLDRTLRVWDAIGGTLVTTRPLDVELPTCLALSRDQRCAFVGAADGALHVVELAGTGSMTRHGHLRAVHAVSVSPDGTRCATAGADGVVCLWDAGQKAPLRTFDCPSEAHSVAFGFDGAALLAGLAGGPVATWSL